MAKAKSVAQEKIYEIFGEWMKTMLAERIMTQGDMARKTGLRESTIQKYCQGRMLPTKSPKNVYAIAQALGIDVENVKKKIQEAKAAQS